MSDGGSKRARGLVEERTVRRDPRAEPQSDPPPPPADVAWFPLTREDLPGPPETPFELSRESSTRSTAAARHDSPLQRDSPKHSLSPEGGPPSMDAANVAQLRHRLAALQNQLADL